MPRPLVVTTTPDGGARRPPESDDGAGWRGVPRRPAPLHIRPREERTFIVMPSDSLAAALARAGSPVQLLRNLSFPPSTFPVQPEFTNWRTESRSWLETCALLDQSHHMTDLFIEGPDALEL